MKNENDITLLDKAKFEEKNYRWEKSAELYDKVAGIFLEKNKLENAAKIYSKLGDICFRTVLASETKEDYLNWVDLAVKAFYQAEKLYDQLNNELLSRECKARGLYTKSYVIASVEQTKQDLKQSIDILLDLNETYTKTDDKRNSVKVSISAIESLMVYLVLSEDPSEMAFYSQLANNLKESAWSILKEVDSIIFRERLLYNGSMLVNFVRWTELTYGDKKQEERYKKFIKRSEETLELLKNCDNYANYGGVHANLGFIYSLYGGLYSEVQKDRVKFVERGFKLMEESLALFRESRDNRGIVTCTYCLDYQAGVFGRYEYLQKRILNDMRVFQKFDKIFDNLYTGFYCFVDFIPITYYNDFASRSFLRADTRKSYAKVGIDYANIALKRLAFGPYIVFAYQYLTLFYSQLIILATEDDPQEEYIQKMMYNAKKTENLAKTYKGGNIRAAGYISLYRAYKTLSDITRNKEEKINNLVLAIEASQNCIKYSIESYRNYLAIQIRLALLHEELGILTNEEKSLKEAREILLRIINDTSEKGYFFYTAACYEYIARLEDRLGNHIVSSECYENAQKAHIKSLEAIEYRLLKERVNEKINYAYAWSLIEKAKVNHKKENHLEARSQYEKACDILKDLPNYNHEGAYFSSWATLEKAEQQSKEEKLDEAIDSYENAKDLFDNASMAIRFFRKNVRRSKDLKKLEKVAKMRINYCSARVNLEKARILTKKGDHIEAAERFASAATQFKSICTLFKIKCERKELEAVYYLCKAWENMELAEQTEDPIKYSNSAKLFIKASDLFIESKLKFLALGNSHFCLALELGCNFDKSNELKVKAELYPKIKSILRNAADSYEKGGFESESDWVLATSTYFDAAWHLIQADYELRIDKKKELLNVGINYLKASGQLFGKAGYKNKEKEAFERVKRIKKEEKILISALNTITEPSISRSIEGIIAPSCPIETSQSPRIGEIQQYSEEVSTFMEKDSMKAKIPENIKLFISYATTDSNYFQVSKIASLLEENPEIEKVLYWEEDLHDDIYDYMNKNLAKCDAFLLFCSENANQSEPVQMEWKSALKIKKKIIPIFIKESDIPPLISTKLGVQFNKDDIGKSAEQIYQLVLRKLEI